MTALEGSAVALEDSAASLGDSAAAFGDSAEVIGDSVAALEGTRALGTVGTLVYFRVVNLTIYLFIVYKTPLNA